MNNSNLVFKKPTAAHWNNILFLTHQDFILLECSKIFQHKSSIVSHFEIKFRLKPVYKILSCLPLTNNPFGSAKNLWHR